MNQLYRFFSFQNVISAIVVVDVVVAVVVANINVARFSVLCSLVQTYQISLIGCQQIITKLREKLHKKENSCVLHPTTTTTTKMTQNFFSINMIDVVLSNPSERFSLENFNSFFMVNECVYKGVCSVCAPFALILGHSYTCTHINI